MLQKTVFLILAVALLCVGSGCKKAPPPPKAGELTPAQRAEFLKRAVKQYEVIVEKYPESEYAPKAKERLAELRAQQERK